MDQIGREVAMQTAPLKLYLTEDFSTTASTRPNSSWLGSPRDVVDRAQESQKLSVASIRRRFSSKSASTCSCLVLGNLEITVNDDASTRKFQRAG